MERGYSIVAYTIYHAYTTHGIKLGAISESQNYHLTLPKLLKLFKLDGRTDEGQCNIPLSQLRWGGGGQKFDI